MFTGVGDEDNVCKPCAPDGEEDVDLSSALLGDPIVGHGPTLLDANGHGALKPIARSPPPTMTPAEKAKHNLTRLPFHPRCPICVATRRPNAHHRRPHEQERTIPLLVADDCFVKTAGGVVMQTCVALRLYPYKLYDAVAIPRKGTDQSVISYISRVICTCGVLKMAYRCDRRRKMIWWERSFSEHNCLKA